MSAFTPGPWTVEQDLVSNGDIDIHAGDFLAVAFINVREDASDMENVPRETALANARLIAAAPDLLEACKRTIADIEVEQGADVAPAVYQALLDAVAKAEGR